MRGSDTEHGFTLIELSIVLVIIGLLVGGVLVGQSLIEAATVRAEVTQLDRYNTAANIFNSKYGGLPGDLLNGINFFTLPASGASAQNASIPGYGNGDGLVQSLNTGVLNTCSLAAGSYNCLAGENLVFWYELSQAGLIPERLTCNNYKNCNNITSSMIPAGKISGSMVSLNAYNGINYWVLANQSSSIFSGVSHINAPGLSVQQAFQIDTKIDDGDPSAGTVVSIAGGSPGLAADTNSGTATSTSSGGIGNFVTNSISTNCTNGSPAGTPETLGTAYNITNAATAVNCQLSVRANF